MSLKIHRISDLQKIVGICQDLHLNSKSVTSRPLSTGLISRAVDNSTCFLNNTFYITVVHQYIFILTHSLFLRLLSVSLNWGCVSLLSRCHILASAKHSGCIWQYQWERMSCSRWQNSAAVRGDAAVCWLVNSRWRLCEKICNSVPFNIYCIAQLNENITTFCFTV